MSFIYQSLTATNAAAVAAQAAAVAAQAAAVEAKNRFFGLTCKAWVKFSVSGGVATISSSFNVASMVRNAVGQFTVNLTTGTVSAVNAFDAEFERGGTPGLRDMLGVSVSLTAKLLTVWQTTVAAGATVFTLTDPDTGYFAVYE